MRAVNLANENAAFVAESFAAFIAQGRKPTLIPLGIGKDTPAVKMTAKENRRKISIDSGKYFHA